jgi:hypothetical protein
MSKGRDPYRQDTKGGRRDGRWFADQIDAYRPHGTVHLRGLHYILVSREVIKPDGQPYRNTTEDYSWLADNAAAAARWLGYVDHARIVDERNAPPESFIAVTGATTPELYLTTGSYADKHIFPNTIEVIDPFPPAVTPSIGSYGGTSCQPYRIIFIGEKVSLRPILEQIAMRVGGELILPTGDISDTLLFGMAARAAMARRPSVVLYFSDFDPAGWNMPIVVARKLQALCDLKHPNLDIRVYRVALTYEQVTDLDLPSTPLKEGERRADAWRARWDREQTEIDALAALQPGVLRDVANEAIKPFYDSTLARRTDAAAGEWQRQANATLQAEHGPLLAEAKAAIEAALEAIAEPAMTALREAVAEVEPAFERVRDAVDAFNEIKSDWDSRLTDAITLPEPWDLPRPVLADPPEPLFDSTDDWRAATAKLIAARHGE